MKKWRVYYNNWDYGLHEAIEENCWEYEADTEQECWDWIDAHDYLDGEEFYDVYCAED